MVKGEKTSPLLSFLPGNKDQIKVSTFNSPIKEEEIERWKLERISSANFLNHFFFFFANLGENFSQLKKKENIPTSQFILVANIHFFF